ncbi:hypothetical protein SAQUA_03335 [Serratia aquatilis]|uniref:hypothetical protein n=1 Tax=Serratia aquatilis TaxID=1737515 RepID=UPI00384CCDA8
MDITAIANALLPQLGGKENICHSPEAGRNGFNHAGSLVAGSVHVRMTHPTMNTDAVSEKK